MYIDLIAGARPNFMKIAPIIDAIKKKNKNRVQILTFGWYTPVSTTTRT